MYEKLKKLCKERGLSVTRLCELVTGNSGNLATWKKGTMRSDYLAGCCCVLGISADELLDLPAFSPSVISPDEQGLLDLFRSCSEADRKSLLDMAEFFASREAAARSKRAE